MGDYTGNDLERKEWENRESESNFGSDFSD
jgi:hypothetical protein